MTSRRALKAAEAIREVVSMAILTEIKDPRIRDVTVTYVEVSPDLRYAKVHVSVMGDETRQNLSLRGLRHAAGFLQSKVARRIEARYTPKLEFLLDQGVKRSIEVARILHEVLPRPSPPDSQEQEGAAAGEEVTEEVPDGAARATDDSQPPAEDAPGLRPPDG